MIGGRTMCVAGEVIQVSLLVDESEVAQSDVMGI